MVPGLDRRKQPSGASPKRRFGGRTGTQTTIAVSGSHRARRTSDNTPRTGAVRRSEWRECGLDARKRWQAPSRRVGESWLPGMMTIGMRGLRTAVQSLEHQHVGVGRRGAGCSYRSAGHQDRVNLLLNGRCRPTSARTLVNSSVRARPRMVLPTCQSGRGAEIALA